MNTTNTIETVQIKLDGVQQVMKENIQFALQNTDKIEDIQTKSELLADSSNQFRERGKQLKNQIRCKYWKNIIITAVILVLFILFMYYATR